MDFGLSQSGGHYMSWIKKSNPESTKNCPFQTRGYCFSPEDPLHVEYPEGNLQAASQWMDAQAGIFTGSPAGKWVMDHLEARVSCGMPQSVKVDKRGMSNVMIGNPSVSPRKQDEVEVNQDRRRKIKHQVAKQARRWATNLCRKPQIRPPLENLAPLSGKRTTASDSETIP